MSQDTKRADPQTHTSVQHKPWQFSATQHPASCKFELYEQRYFGPTCETTLPPEVEITSGRLKNGVGEYLCQFAYPMGKITNIAALMPFSGMVLS